MDTFATTTSASRRALRSKARKLGTPRGSIGAFALLAIVAAAAASAGAFGTFTDTKTASQALSSGTVAITVGDGTDGDPANRLTIGASDLAAGDDVQRAVDITNSGTIDLSDISLTTTSSTSNVLTTDATNGLQVEVQLCPGHTWTETGTSAPFTYTCSATPVDLVASSGVIQADTSLAFDAPTTELAPNAVNHLLVTETLPSTADNTFENLSSTITYSFTATQRTATDK
jgi:spore coat-associated protein N